MRPSMILACAIVLASAHAAVADPIGRVKSSEGAAFIVSGSERKPAVPGTTVVTEDVLETGSDGRMGITVIDETKLSVGPDTSIALAEYAFAPAETKYGFLARMSRGTALFVSGLLGKLSPESVSVETPTGTIGIRGTRFLVRVSPDV